MNQEINIKAEGFRKYLKYLDKDIKCIYNILAECSFHDTEDNSHKTLM